MSLSITEPDLAPPPVDPISSATLLTFEAAFPISRCTTHGRSLGGTDWMGVGPPGRKGGGWGLGRVRLGHRPKQRETCANNCGWHIKRKSWGCQLFSPWKILFKLVGQCVV